MTPIIKIAIRNIRRNIRSTLLNGAGITLSVVLLLLIFSLSRGIEEQIVSRSIRFETGALTIDFDGKTSSFENASGDSLFHRIKTVLDNTPGISGYTFRIYPEKSILYLSDRRQSVNVTGMTDEELPLLAEMVKILEGKAEYGDANKGIVISNCISVEYGLKTGDECSIMTQSADGSVNLDDFVVTGIFRYTSQMNKYNVYMDYGKAKELYHANLPSKIVINVHNVQNTPALKTRLSTQLSCRFLPDNPEENNCDGFTVSAYYDHTGMAKTLSDFNRYGMFSVAIFLILISFVGIWSMQIENTDNRSRETGTLLSVGFSLTSLKNIFLIESVIISLVYFTAGIFIAAVIILAIHLQNGIYLGVNASFAFGSSIVNLLLSWKDVVFTFTVTLIYPLIATAASLFPLNKKSIIHLLQSH